MFNTRLLTAAVALLLVTGAVFLVTDPWGLSLFPRLFAPETVPVVVAARDIPAFGVITPSMVTTRDLPRGRVPAGALTKVEYALDRSALGSLMKGEVLFSARLGPRGAV